VLRRAGAATAAARGAGRALDAAPGRAMVAAARPSGAHAPLEVEPARAPEGGRKGG